MVIELYVLCGNDILCAVCLTCQACVSLSPVLRAASTPSPVLHAPGGSPRVA